MDVWVLAIGTIIIGLVFVWLVVSIQHTLQQTRYANLANDRSLDLLEQRIDSAKRSFAISSIGWNGYRKFEIVRKVEETHDTCSFYLAPHDGKPLSAFRPGQYLTIRLQIPGREKPVVRCYSLSDQFEHTAYRISVKKAAPPQDSPMAPPGLVSSYFHEQLGTGDLLDLQAPSGHFVLDPHDARPAVLIAGGIGITPILSMAETIIASGSGREFIIFYGVRNGRDHAFMQELKNLEANRNCRLVVCYSRATEEDQPQEGSGFQHHGRLSVELMRNYLDSTNYEFLMCGLPSMMTDLTSQLLAWGVAKSSISFEAFGPESVKKTSAPRGKESGKVAGRTPECMVTFSRSGISSAWDPSTGNLLEFAQDQGVDIASGCRAGNCGSCLVAIKSGDVEYQTEPGSAPESGSCLPCVAFPKGDLTLDA